MIGNYVHFKYKTYLKHGLSKDGTGEGPQAALAEAHNRLRQMGSKGLSSESSAKLLKLEQIMNDYMSFKRLQSKGNQNIGDGDKNIQYIEKMVKEVMQKTSSRLVNRQINYGTGIVAYSSDSTANISGKKQVIGGDKRNEDSVGFYIETLVKRMSDLENKINNFLQKGFKNPSMEKEYDEINNLCTQIYDLYDSGGFSKTGFVPKAIGGELATKINNLNEMFSKLGTDNLGEGEFAEILALVGGQLLDEVATDNVDKVIEDWTDKVYKQSTAQAIPIGKVRGGSKTLGKSLAKGRIGLGDYWLSKGTPQKVDVTIKLSTGDLNISVKSHNMSHPEYGGHIDVHSGTSLLALLQEEESFLNHWLNVVPDRVGGPHGLENFVYAGNKAAFQIALKALAVVKAMTGTNRINLENPNNVIPFANALLILDNSTGKVKVYSIAKIAEVLSKNMNYAKEVRMGGAFDKMDIENKWEDSGNGVIYSKCAATRRVSKMLMELHKMQLDIQLPVSILNQVK